VTGQTNCLFTIKALDLQPSRLRSYLMLEFRMDRLKAKPVATDTVTQEH
jgi:hypothetical protein